MKQQHMIYGLGALFVIAVVLLIIPVQEKEGRRSGHKIVVLGDSLSAGYNLPPEASFVAKLQDAFDKRKIQVNLINMSVSGDTTAGGLNRLTSVINQKPVAVIISLGANDMLRNVPTGTTKGNLEAIIKRLQENNIKVMLIGMMASPNLQQKYQSEFNNIFPMLAQTYRTDFYPFFLDGVAGVADMNLPDGVHPNEKGVETMVEKFMVFGEPFVASLTAE